VSINTDKQIKALLKAGKPVKKACGNGLYFRVSKEVTGFWLYKYSLNKVRKDMTIGRYPEMSFADANKRTFELRNLVANHKDPQIEKKRGSQNTLRTVDDLGQDWLESITKKVKFPKTPIRIYTKDISPLLGKILLTDVSPLDVRQVIENINESGRPSIANDALGYMKQLFRHGIKLGFIISNPAIVFSPEDAGGNEVPRKRYLSQEEIKEVFKQIDIHIETVCYQNKLAFFLLLSLGVRKGELIESTWSEFDFGKRIWRIPAERTKTNTAFEIPLTDNVYSVFMELKVLAMGSNNVFPNRRASKRSSHISGDTLNRALDRLFDVSVVKFERFTVHDLRRSFRSLLAELKIPSHIGERCLNHKIRGVEGVYDRYDYFEERKEALEKISKELALLVL
jgi:integrase